MVGVQDENLVQRAGVDRVDDVFLARNREAHPQEVRRVVEVVLRIHEGLADRVLVGHRRQRRHLRDHAQRGDHPLRLVRDVGRVMIEGRERADAGHHHRHRVRVAAETLEEAVHLVVHHGVARDPVVEIRLLGRAGQLAEQHQVGGLEEVAVLGELLDRVAAIEQHALVAVDISDLRLAGGGRGEARIEGELAGLGVELADIDHVGADRSGLDGQFDVFVAHDDGAGGSAHGIADPFLRREQHWTGRHRLPPRCGAAAEHCARSLKHRVSGSVGAQQRWAAPGLFAYAKNRLDLSLRERDEIGSDPFAHPVLDDFERSARAQMTLKHASRQDFPALDRTMGRRRKVRLSFALDCHSRRREAHQRAETARGAPAEPMHPDVLCGHPSRGRLRPAGDPGGGRVPRRGRARPERRRPAARWRAP